MYLVTAATDLEMKPFVEASRIDGIHNLVTGVGPVETAVRLFSWLSRNGERVHGVVNFGVAGAYLQPDHTTTPQLLDMCLAQKEIFGDLGVCLEDRIEPFTNKELRVVDTLDMDQDLLNHAAQTLEEKQIPFFSGVFVTVNCSSGTARRGHMLAGQHGALCENMEGAAVARVCKEFSLPCLELRCISNLVEDRDTTSWLLKKACRRAGEVTALVMDHLAGQPGPI